jgi:tetratricopeptide (TPR) repeat protein
MDSRQVIARFEAERQALALMEHVNIARVLDAGSTGTGRPYFVMELVKGVPLTKYCDEHRLTPKQRLELFIPVCQAVQHAHQKGIIHRDLKPSNVLVALYDGKPVPKVIDFGVAKAAGQALTDKTLVTGFGNIVGTLEYMSPEQAEINQLDIDTRSDIYSLGVLLYELLAGSPPFTRKDLEKAGMLEMLRVIREKEPPKPSTKLSTAEGLPTLAANRGTEPAKLARLVRGELDWIVMKALEKDRDRRYETANAFATDVQRHLADEPVLACPHSAAYRLRKFARRNKGMLSVAAGLFLAVTVIAVTIGWAVRDRAAREQEAANEQREREKRSTAQIELILNEVDRLEREQRWPEALAAVARAEAALAGGDAGDAIRQGVADARRDVGFVTRLDRIRQDRSTNSAGWDVAGIVPDALRDIGFRGAERDYALAFRGYGVDIDALPTEEAVARLRARPALALPVAAALDDWMEARRARNQPTWGPLVAIARGLDPDPVRDRIRAVWDQPVTQRSQAELLRVARSIDVKTASSATLQTLVRTLDRYGLVDAAIRIARDGQLAHPADFWLSFVLGQFLRERNDRAGAVRYYSIAVSLRPDAGAAHNNLGLVLIEMGEPGAAIGELREALRIQPGDLTALNNLSIALGAGGQPDEALAACREGIRLNKEFAPLHTNLGNLLAARGQHDAAIAEFREAIRLGPEAPQPHYNLGNSYAAKKLMADAIAEYREAIRIEKAYYEAHHNLAEALTDEGRLEEAIAEHREAIRLKKEDPQHHFGLGRALSLDGQRDGAMAAYREAIRLKPDHASAHNNLGTHLAEKSRLDEAIAEFREAVRFKKDNARFHDNLGHALCNKGLLDQAITAYREAIRIRKDFDGAHYHLANALRDMGRLNEAVAEYHEVIRIRKDFAEAHCNLGHTLRQQGQFRQALEELRRGHELGSRDPAFRSRYPSGEWVQKCERLVELDERLPGLLARKTRPASPAEQIELADLCILKQLHGAAARFYEEAFAAEARLADDLNAGHRYRAARLAALAGCGQGKDADRFDDEERACLRRQALDWLRADLKAGGRLLDQDADRAPAAARVASALRHWLLDPDFVGVRGWGALARLPAAERPPWQKLWDDVAATRNRAEAVLNRKEIDPKDELAAARKAVALYPRMPAAHFVLGVALGHQDRAGALAAFRKAVELDPGYALARLWLGQTLLFATANSGKPELEEAVAVYSKVVELDPANNGGWYNRGLARQKLGRWQGALDDYSRAIQLIPTHSAALLGRAEVHAAQGQWDRAVADYERAIEAARSNPALRPGAYNGLAWLLATCPDARFRDPARAVGLARQAVALMPKGSFHRYYTTLGAACYRAGDPRAALAALSQSPSPDAADWLLLAMSHQKLGASEEARRWYDRAIEWLEKNKPLLDQDKTRAEQLRRFRSEAEEVLEMKK